MGWLKDLKEQRAIEPLSMIYPYEQFYPLDPEQLDRLIALAEFHIELVKGKSDCPSCHLRMGVEDLKAEIHEENCFLSEDYKP